MQKVRAVHVFIEDHGASLFNNEGHELYFRSEVDALIAEHQSTENMQDIRIKQLEKALASLLHFSEIVEVDEECDFFEDFTAAQEKARSLMDTGVGK